MMPQRITHSVELVLGGLTFVSTFITGDILIDVIVGVLTYTLARLFWRYFGSKIIKKIEWIKAKFR